MSHYNVLFQSVGTGRDSPQETSFFPFPEWEDEFKTLIFEKREFNFTQVYNVGFSFFSYSSLLSHFEAGTNELIEEKNKPEIKVFLPKCQRRALVLAE